jgi:hypothetical protein
MRLKIFIAELQSLDKRVRFVPGPGPSSGLYKMMPGHPEAHENGLVWIAALPSPSWFLGQIPEYDFFDEKNQYHRGWRHILRLLQGQGWFSKAQFSRAFGSDWAYKYKGAPIKLPTKAPSGVSDAAGRYLGQAVVRPSWA